MKVVKLLNNYLFDTEDVSVADSLWFYGTMGIILICGIILWVI